MMILIMIHCPTDACILTFPSFKVASSLTKIMQIITGGDSYSEHTNIPFFTLCNYLWAKENKYSFEMTSSNIFFYDIAYPRRSYYASNLSEIYTGDFQIESENL